jgi:hypothetical protein
MPSIKFHSANLTLDELRDQCQALQEHDVTKLVHLQGATVETSVNDQTIFNQAQYVVVSHFSAIPELQFVKVDDPDDIPSMITDALAKGGKLIFDEIVFVNKQEQRVLGFGIVS